MQKTDQKTTRLEKTGKPSGWLGLLLIAIVSGLVVRVVGDPLVEVFGPKLENAVEEAGDFIDEQLDQNWGKKLRHWFEQQQER
ncbi:MAG: hypothetical protein ACKO7W_02720 [Elainella sp.]